MTWLSWHWILYHWRDVVNKVIAGSHFKMPSNIISKFVNRCFFHNFKLVQIKSLMQICQEALFYCLKSHLFPSLRFCDAKKLDTVGRDFPRCLGMWTQPIGKKLDTVCRELPHCLGMWTRPIGNMNISAICRNSIHLDSNELDLHRTTYSWYSPFSI
jgi:hypothetical protein